MPDGLGAAVDDERRARALSAWIPPRLRRRMLDLTGEQQRHLIDDMSVMDLLSFDADFETWAHDGQLPPGGEGWRVWLMMAGRGFGKTRAGAEWVHRLARGKAVRIALVAASIDEARSVMVEGASGVLSVARRHRAKVTWEPSLGRLTWPGGSMAQLYSGANPDGLRGPEHGFAWCAAAARHNRCGSCEGAARRGASGCARAGELLPGRQCAVGRMGRPFR